MAYVAAWPPGHTPYVTPDQLNSWPTGVQFSTIPPQASATPAQNYAVLATLCRQATVRADQIVNTPLRSVMTTEDLEGPNYRVTVQWASGNGRFVASRWPVTQVTNVQVAPNNTFPRSWTVLPAGSYEPEFPVDGLYGASVPSAGAGGPVDHLRARLPRQLRRLGQPVHPAAALPGQRHLPVRLAAHLASPPPSSDRRHASRPWTTAPAGSSPAPTTRPSGRRESSTTRSAAARNHSASLRRQ